MKKYSGFELRPPASGARSLSLVWYSSCIYAPCCLLICDVRGLSLHPCTARELMKRKHFLYRTWCLKAPSRYRCGHGRGLTFFTRKSCHHSGFLFTYGTCLRLVGKEGDVILYISLFYTCTSTVLYLWLSYSTVQTLYSFFFVFRI
jgi:hypothetical protein